MSYSEHLQGLIRKSTFTVSKEGWKDGWIDPFGDFTPLETHHHVEVALSIIKSMDNEIDEAKENMKEHEMNLALLQEFLEVASKIPEDSTLIKQIVNGFFDKSKDLSGYILRDLQFCQSVRQLLMQTKSYIRYLKEEILANKRWLKTKSSEVEKFEKANKNKGYDAAEYLIINYGYVALESGHLLYRKAKQTQMQHYDCYVENDNHKRCVIVKLTPQEIREKKAKVIKRLTNLAEFYSEPMNRFHCPSGFTRMGYERWLRECREVGLDGDELIYNRAYRYHY